MKALIFKGKVVDLAKKEFPVAPGMEWVTAPRGCQHGWLYQDGEFTDPTPPPDEQDARELRRRAFNDAEAAGELPVTAQDNIDEMWKALEALAAGDNLPGAAVDIIRTRKDIKARFPKG